MDAEKGSRLRIDISSSLHLYHAHPNRRKLGCSTERVTAKQTIYCGTEYHQNLFCQSTEAIKIISMQGSRNSKEVKT